MDRYVVFTDGALASIESQVAAHRPERGGALIGPVGLPLISGFVHDEDARTSGSTFRPSRALQAEVTRIERRDRNLELKGMLHSHPGDMDHPSGGDRHAFADSLSGAPWLGRFVAPIVTCGTAPSGPHEIGLPSGKMSVFIAEPVSGRGEVDVQPAVVRVLPITAHTGLLADVTGGRRLSQGLVEVDGAVYLTGGVEVSGLELQVLFPAGYPTQAPVVLAVPGDRMGPAGRHLLSTLLPEADEESHVVAVPLHWDLAVPEDHRLVHCLRLDRRTAPEAARDGIRRRLDGAESPVLATRSVLIAGAGSGGSLTADALARSGVERFVLIDADKVGAENVSRSIYRMNDVGMTKVAALRRHLQAINPLVTCEILADRLQDVPRPVLDRLVSESDLVVGATDDVSAQQLLDHFAYARGVPAIFGGVYARAQAGEVVFTLRGITRCLRCTTTGRHQDENQRRTVDYGTGQLVAEPALGADIQHIVTASVKIAIGLLQLDQELDGEPASSSRALVYSALTARTNYAIFSTVPDYSFFADIFRGVRGQLAYQSVWMGAQGNPDCVVCGTDPLDPLAEPARARAPQISALRPLGPA